MPSQNRSPGGCAITAKRDAVELSRPCTGESGDVEERLQYCENSGVGNLPPAYAKLRRSREARGRDAMYTEASAPRPFCFAEPTRLKSTRDCTHRWVKEG